MWYGENTDHRKITHLITPYTSLLNTSKGGLFNIPRLLKSPIRTVNEVMIRNNNNTGKISGVKLVSKVNRAKDQLAMSDKMIPAPAAKEPRKKYSSAVITRICFLLAPIVLNKTLSLIL